MSDLDDDTPHVLPIDGTLDLHTFHPSDVADVVLDYLEACRAEGQLEVRIIHGKGKGVLKRIVRATLARIDWVTRVQDGEIGGGSWGATLVDLAPHIADEHRVVNDKRS